MKTMFLLAALIATPTLAQEPKVPEPFQKRADLAFGPTGTKAQQTNIREAIAAYEMAIGQDQESEQRRQECERAKKLNPAIRCER